MVKAKVTHQLDSVKANERLAFTPIEHHRHTGQHYSAIVQLERTPAPETLPSLRNFNRCA